LVKVHAGFGGQQSANLGAAGDQGCVDLLGSRSGLRSQVQAGGDVPEELLVAEPWLPALGHLAGTAVAVGLAVLVEGVPGSKGAAQQADLHS